MTVLEKSNLRTAYAVHSRAKWAAKFPWTIISDIAAFTLAVGFAVGLVNIAKSLFGASPLVLDPDEFRAHLAFTIVLAGICVFWLSARGHYRLRLTLSAQLKDVVQACMIALFVAAFVQFAFKTQLSRLLVVSTWVLAMTGLAAGRIALRRIGEWTEIGKVPVLLVGGPNRHSDFEVTLRKHRDLGYIIRCRMDYQELLDELHSLPVEVQRQRIEDYLHRSGSRQLVVAPSAVDYEMGLRVIEQLQRMGVPYIFAPDTGTIPVDNMTVQHIAPLDGLLLNPHDNLQRPLARALKFAIEITFAASVLLLISPFFVFCWVVIRQDGGPLFFSQPRVGRNSRPFACLKFRTMVTDADKRLADLLKADRAAAAEWALSQKLSNDPRVTRLGSFLRKTSLDELPQLINVLRGDMSMVGPRPVVPGELERYGEDAAYYLRVRPGLTGMWQVNGRNKTTYEERVRLDGFYVRNWSLWRDLTIALKTIPEILWERSGM